MPSLASESIQFGSSQDPEKVVKLEDSGAETIMATTFKAQLLDNEHLPHNLRAEFYETMKQTVVVVRVCYYSGTPTYWGGVCVGPEGLVVTAAHILPSNSKSVSFRCHGESNFVPANVIHTDVRSNLLLLRRKKIGDDCSRNIPYVECCPDMDIHVGMEAIAIGHPCSMVYTIAIGHVAFPVCGLDDPYEKVPCIVKTPNTRRMIDCKFGDCEDLECHRDDLQLIQLNNIHGSTASAGSAIFTSAGLLLGVEIFVHSNFDFCVHIHTIKHFTEQGLKAEKTKGESSQGLLEMKNIKYPKTDQKGRGKDGRKRNIVSLTKLRTDRERVKPQNLSPFEDIHVEDIHVTKTNPKSSIPSCITDFVTPKRLLLEVSPTISKKLKVSPTVDKRLVLGTGNPEVYQGKAFMDNFGYSNGVPEMKNVANLELRTLIDGNVEKSEACAQEIDDESEMDPKGSKHRMVIITERRGFSEISSTINKEVVTKTCLLWFFLLQINSFFFWLS